MFDKTRFRLMLERAKGDRKIIEYQNDSGVNRTYLSKYLNEKLDRPPSPDIIKQLADAAQNNVTYWELMEAAGHVSVELTPLGYNVIQPGQPPISESELIMKGLIKKGFEHFPKLSESNLPELPSNLPFKVDSRTRKQWKELLEKGGQAFFYNDEIDEEDKKEMLDLLTEFFIDAKVKNKVKYGRKKKKESEVVDDGGNA